MYLYVLPQLINFLLWACFICGTREAIQIIQNRTATTVRLHFSPWPIYLLDRISPLPWVPWAVCNCWLSVVWQNIGHELFAHCHTWWIPRPWMASACFQVIQMTKIIWSTAFWKPRSKILLICQTGIPAPGWREERKCSLPLLCFHWSKQLYTGSQPDVLVSSSYHQSLHAVALVGRKLQACLLWAAAPCQTDPVPANQSQGHQQCWWQLWEMLQLWANVREGANTKTSEEGRGGAPGAGADVPQQLREKTMAKQIVPWSSGESQWSRYPSWRSRRTLCHSSH